MLNKKGDNIQPWHTPFLSWFGTSLTHLKRPWCWERLRAGGEGDNRGWDGWMASRTQWTWVWVNSGSWWWTGRPDVLRFMGSQIVRHNWATELNWTDTLPSFVKYSLAFWHHKIFRLVLYFLCPNSGINFPKSSDFLNWRMTHRNLEG